MLKKEMKIKNLVFSLVFSLVLFPTQIFAQSGKIKNVELNFATSEGNPDVLDAKYNIDLAYEHESTKSSVGMWGWRAVVYSVISASQDEEVKKMNLNNDAAEISAQAFLKYYEFSEVDQKKFSLKDYTNAYIISTIVDCFNKGIVYSMDTAQFENTKKYMNYVTSLIKNDELKKAQENNITIAKANYIIWNSAINNKLEKEEMVYLQKLMDEPNYNNFQVFIRASELYLKEKNYEKAIEVLEKGKNKIPTKSGEFLNQQINIEIERKNIGVLLAKFTEAIAAQPDNKEYYFSRGVAIHQLKNEDKEIGEKEFKNSGKIVAAKYYYKSALSDYKKALELDPGYFDAIYNEAVLMLDSADFVYRMKSKVAGGEYLKYDKLSTYLYKDVVAKKFVEIYEMNVLKDQEALNLVKVIRTVYAKINDDENRAKYDRIYKEEQKKLK